MNKRILLASLLLSSTILMTSGLFPGLGSLDPSPASAFEPSKLGPVQVPVILDGVRYEPVAYNRIKDNLTSQGINLRYLLTRDAVAQGIVYVFTSEAKEKEFKRQRGLPVDLPTPGSVSKLKPLSVTQIPIAQYFEHISFQGDWLTLEAGSGNADLRNISCCGGGNWNDRISSVHVDTGVYSYNWEHINFQGQLLTIMGWANVEDLRLYGWNDVISSVWEYWTV